MLTIVKSLYKQAGRHNTGGRCRAAPAALTGLSLRTALGLSLGLLLYGCDAVVNHFAFFPDRTDVLAETALPEGVEAFSVTTDDAVRIHALYLPAPRAGRVLVYFHGNAGNIFHRIPDLLRLRQTGVSVVGVSYRGYGKSEGVPDEQGIYRDGEAIFEHVTRVLGYPEDQVILFGRSIGSAVAVNIAQGRQINGLILVTPLTSGRAAAEANGFGFMSAFAGDAFDNLAKIKTLKAPLLVVHGTGDRIIPFTMGRQLYEAAVSRKRLVAIEGAGHNNLQSAYATLYWPPIIEFIATLSHD